MLHVKICFASKIWVKYHLVPFCQSFEFLPTNNMVLKILIIFSTTFIQLVFNLNIAGECIFSEFIGSVPAKGINTWWESSQMKNFEIWQKKWYRISKNIQIYLTWFAPSNSISNCQKNDLCLWNTFYPDSKMCLMYSECKTVDRNRCSNCVTNPKNLPKVRCDAKGICKVSFFFL